MLTKGKFLELLKSLDPEPNFLTMIIKECFSKLPDAVAWKLSKQLYLNYFWDGPVYKIKNNLSGEELLFCSYTEIVMYLTKLGYETTNQKVAQAFRQESTKYCNHTFYAVNKEKKEITYFE